MKQKELFMQRLAAALADKGWSQSDLARKAQTGRDNISGYLKGRALPRLDQLNRLAQALGVSPWYLMPVDGDEAAASKVMRGFQVTELPDREGIVRFSCDRELPVEAALEIVSILNRHTRVRGAGVERAAPLSIASAEVPQAAAECQQS